MKKVIFLTVLMLISINLVFSQSGETKKSPFQFTFFPPVGTQGTNASQYSNDVSFNMLVGISQNERYFTLGGLVNIVKNDASGFQLAGLSNVIGNNAKGFQLAGISNTLGGNGKGILLSGVLNASNEYRGAQVAGIANISSSMNGFQLAGVGNIAEDVNGFQLAGIFNKAKNVKGVQFAGILNIADNSDYPIGLINIIKNGEMGVGVSYNEIGSTVLSFRSGGRVMYGILGVGYNHRAESKESFVIEGGIGAHINCSSSFRINTEAKAHYLSAFNKKETSQYSLGILPALKLGSNFEVFAGPTVNYLRSDNVDNEKFFPKNTSINIWKSFDASELEQVYIGFSAGVQYVF